MSCNFSLKPIHWIIQFNKIFHYKPSSYGGTSIYVNLHMDPTFTLQKLIVRSCTWVCRPEVTKSWGKRESNLYPLGYDPYGNYGYITMVYGHSSYWNRYNGYVNHKKKSEWWPSNIHQHAWSPWFCLFFCFPWLLICLASRSPYVSARNSQPVTAPEIPTIHHPRSYIPGLVNIEKTIENGQMAQSK